MTQVTCRSIRPPSTMAVNMALTSLLVCADAQGVQVLSRILQDLSIGVEPCGDLRMAQARIEDRHFDALLVDCQDEPAALGLIACARNAPTNHTTVIIAMVSGLNHVREIFAQGANFALYKPISRERAAHSMRAARGLMQRERRLRPRIPVQGDASMAHVGKENVAAALVDLSEEGIAFHSQEKLPPYCKVYLQFALPGNNSQIRLAGEVMWQDSGGRMGIRFAHVPQTSRRMLTSWLQANLASQLEAAVPLESESPSRDDASLHLSAGLGLLSGSVEDRRSLSRQACTLGAEIYRVDCGVPQRCSLGDISSGGCYVETTETLPSGTPLEIVVRTQELRLRIRGKVRSTHPGFGMGVEFVLRTDDQRRQVQELMACASSEPKLSGS
jgi:CheY-like chemotaxis protein